MTRKFASVLAANLVQTFSATSQASGVADNDPKCVSTPDEFIQAFNARAPVCVSDELVGRIDSGSSVDEALSIHYEMRVASFFSGSDVLEKYLRMGYPEELGWSTINNVEGLASESNGVSMLMQVGYSLEYIDVGKTYVLSVYSKHALRKALQAAESDLPYSAGISPIAATWGAVADFYEYTFMEEGLKLTEAAIHILTHTSFADLTGCLPSCAYSADDFPSVNATTPIVTADRLPDGICPQPTFPSVQPAYSTGIDAWSGLCNDRWQAAMQSTNKLFDTHGCSVEGNKVAGAGLVLVVKAISR